MSILDIARPAFTYEVYGLTLASNQLLPGLLTTDRHKQVDIWVDLIEDPESDHPSTDSAIGRVPFSPKGPATCQFRIEKLALADGSSYFNLWFRGNEQMEPVDFQIDSEGSHISSANWTNSVIEEVTVLLLGPVLKCAIRLQGKICLHGGVLGIGRHAIAILGSSGAGKSTTAAALAGRGHAILSDDIAVLKECSEYFLVQPGYPRLRLWPESVNALYGSEVGLARVICLSEKRFVDLTDNSGESETHRSPWRFHKEPLPLAAIYVLGERQPELANPAIEPISPAMATMTLMAQRSASFLKLDMDKQAREFAGISRVAMTVPVRKVTRRDSLDALPQLCDAILEDLAGIVNES